jgi:hypothetical protein
MGYKFVDITENDTGDALVCEVLSIPLLMRGTSSTPLVPGDSTTKLLDADVILPLPTLSSSDKGRAGLFHGTIGSKLGLPEILR